MKIIKIILKVIAASLLAIFIYFAIYNTFYHIPKYAEYRDGNAKEKIGTGYYSLSTNTVHIFVPPLHTSPILDLQIDYQKWAIIMFTEGFVLLVPAYILYRLSKTKAPN